MKPTRAVDADLQKLKFPVMVLPKIDGVRGLNLTGQLVARSGKPFKNKKNSAFYSRDEFIGFDGEMTVGPLVGEDLCSKTTSALTTIEGEINTYWCLFDYVLDGINNELGYLERYQQLTRKIEELWHSNPDLAGRLYQVRFFMVNNLEELEEVELHYLEQGYEGIILRDPKGKYKYGTSTVNEGYYLRLKRFLDAEIVVTHVVEGETNNNDLKHNPNGYAERSTHRENMVPNGMVGTICGTALQDVSFNGRILIKKGDTIDVAPGKMTHQERENYFCNQSLIVGKIVKYKFFPIGVKDKPRFPTFQSFRDPIDL